MSKKIFTMKNNNREIILIIITLVTIYYIFRNKFKIKKEDFTKECTPLQQSSSPDECKDNTDNVVFDFGFRYMGMGHVQMISCNLYNHLLLFLLHTP